MLTPIFLASWKYTEMLLQRLAAKHREQFQVPVVGITGSNGKISGEGMDLSTVKS